ncbi:hypothetical protein KJ766_03200, partial [Patescibacteria group bacterium]|nr:hypothetical protein [Patescibacteria group bacterium]
LLPLSITASDEIDKAIRIKLKIFEPSNAKKRSTQTVNPEEEKLLGLKLRIMAKLELASVIKEKISDFIKGLELDKKVAAKKSAQEQAN